LCVHQNRLFSSDKWSCPSVSLRIPEIRNSEAFTNFGMGQYPTVIPILPPPTFLRYDSGDENETEKKALTFGDLIANFCNAASAEPRNIAARRQCAPPRVSRTLLRFKQRNRKHDPRPGFKMSLTDDFRLCGLRDDPMLVWALE